MMNIRDYQKEVKSKIVKKFSCIPGIHTNNNAYDCARLTLRETLNSGRYEIKKISIIDKYFDTTDMDTVAHFFGGFTDIELEVITKFDAIDSSVADKDDRKDLIEKIGQSFCKNSLFKKVYFYHSTESMHDRYVLFWAENNILTSTVIIGGSFNQKFEDYIMLYEVEDKYFETCLIKYYYLLLSKTK